MCPGVDVPTAIEIIVLAIFVWWALRKLKAIGMIMKICLLFAIILPIAWAQDEVAVKPLALGDGLKTVGEIAISKDAVAGIPYLGGWQDEAAWRAGMLSWLAWMPNNSTNRSLIA